MTRGLASKQLRGQKIQSNKNKKKGELFNLLQHGPFVCSALLFAL